MNKARQISRWSRRTALALGSTFLVSVACMQPVLAETAQSPVSSADDSIRPFHVHVDQAKIDDLMNRIKNTRWPDKETVGDISQGIQLARVQDLVRYWGTKYDWRKAEDQLNALPQFVTKIDGVDIHFIHVRSHHPNALPVTLTHGWPGSIF